MPLFMIERTFAEQLDLSSDDVQLIEEINGDEGVRWLFSFLSADRRRTYCLYEAPSPEAIVAAARRGEGPGGRGCRPTWWSRSAPARRDSPTGWRTGQRARAQPDTADARFSQPRFEG